MSRPTELLLPDMAQKAFKHFKEQHYELASKILKKIAEKKELDFKVKHNAALNDFFVGQCKEPAKLLKALEGIKTKSDDVSKESEDGVDGYGAFDNSVLRYNQAALRFQLGHYGAAASILQDLYRNNDVLDEGLVVKVCFILLEIYIKQRDSGKASDVIDFLTKPLTISSDDDGDTNSNHSNSSNGTTAAAGASNSLPSNENPMNLVVSDENKFLLHLYKTRVHLLKRNVKLAKKEIKAAVQLYQRNIRNSENHTLTEEHNVAAIFLKTNIEYLRNSHAKAIKGVNSCPKNNSAFSEVLYYNNLGCVHYQLGKKNLALIYFSRALEGCEKVYLSKHGESKKTLPTFANDKKLEILYNTGLCLLAVERFEVASECFGEAAQLFYNRPSLWLRLAECCIRFHIQCDKHKHSKNKNVLTRTEVRDPDGFSHNRRLLLPVADKRLSVAQAAKRSRKFQCTNWTDIDEKIAQNEEALPVYGGSLLQGSNSDPMSLEWAIKYLHNALFLISKTGGSEKLKQVALLNMAYANLCANKPNEALHHCKQMTEMKETSEENKFIANMYAAESYLMLNRPQDAMMHLYPTKFPGLNSDSDAKVDKKGHYLSASNPSPQLSPSSNQSSTSSVSVGSLKLGHSGGSIGRASSPRSSASVDEDISDFGKKKEFDPKVAKASLYCNLAVVYILKGDLQKALQVVQQSLAIDHSFTEALRILIYINIRTGNTKVALRLLKRRRPVPQK